MNLFPCLVSAGLVLATWGTASAATVVEDFERTTLSVTAPGRIEAGPSGSSASGRALALPWTDGHGKWVETSFIKPVALPDFLPDPPRAGSMGLRLSLWLPASGVDSFSVRLSDTSNEIFQWSIRLPPAAASGWRTVLIPINLTQPQGHWSGNNNGIVDGKLALSGFALAFASLPVPAATAWVDDVAMVPLPSATLVTDRFPYLVNATGAARCDLVVDNPADEAIEAVIDGRITDLGGAAVPVSGRLTLSPHGTASLPLPVGERGPGIRWLSYTLRLPGGDIAGATSFVIGDPVERPAPGGAGFLFGICSHPEHRPAAEHEQEMEAIAAAGATVARVGVVWAGVEPQPGVWKWELQDRLVALAAAHGIETQPIVGHGPAHAASAADQAAQADACKAGKKDAWKITLNGAPREEPWRRYVAAFTERYRGKIRFYEIWNEPDLGFWRGTTDEYIARLRSASEEIRRADPAALVLTGGFATVLDHVGRARNPDLQERVLREASDAFDIHAFHQHGPVDEFRQALAGELTRIRAQMPHPRPLLFNETAITSVGIGEVAQAEVLVKKLVLALGFDALGLTWYDLRNDGTQPGDAEQNYGLLTQDFRPKAAFASFRAAARWLGGLHPLGRPAIAPGAEALALSGPARRAIAWWSDAPGSIGAPVPVRGAPDGLQDVDLMGVATDLPLVEGVALAQPLFQPHYLVAAAGAAPLTLGDPLIALGDVAAMPGETTAVPVRLRNPLARPMSIMLAWRGPAGDATWTTDVPALGMVEHTLDFPAPTQGERVQAQAVSWQVAGTPWKGIIRRSVTVTRRLATTSPEGRAPDWTLDRAENLVDLCQADPALKNEAWRGPDDLSAKVWLWCIDDALHLRVAVRDDQAALAGTTNPLDAWKGDGIQVGLRIPGQAEWWELGVARLADGTIQRSIWSMPKRSAPDPFSATVSAQAGGWIYDLTLPFARFAIDAAALQRGLQFNLVVNDNDGKGRKAFLRIAPGLGERKDPSLWPQIGGQRRR